jgi:PIN domain nuclease of toxin-antitoxin system
VRLLLDTNALLWDLAGSDRIQPAVVALIVDPTNEVFVSAASAWEIAVKFALGKLSVSEHPRDWLPRHLAANRFVPLSITIQHALAVADLPRHHRDPFDRILVAQAKLEQLALVTGDEKLAAYGVELVVC